MQLGVYLLARTRDEEDEVKARLDSCAADLGLRRVDGGRDSGGIVSRGYDDVSHEQSLAVEGLLSECGFEIGPKQGPWQWRPGLARLVKI